MLRYYVCRYSLTYTGPALVRQQPGPKVAAHELKSKLLKGGGGVIKGVLKGVI